MNERTLRIAEWSAIAGLGAAGFLNNFTPTPYELRHEVMSANRDITDENLTDLRMCYEKAMFASALLGIAASLIAESPVPLIATAGVSVVMIASYESALPASKRLLSGRTPARIGG